MNFRFFYIALVLVFSYMLFFSWNQESKQKQELDGVAHLQQIEMDQADPDHESSRYVEIENEKLIVNIDPLGGYIMEARLKEYTVLQKDGSLGVRVFGSDGSGFRFYLGSGFGSDKVAFSVSSAQPTSVKLVSKNGIFVKTISLQKDHRGEDDYELKIVDEYFGDIGDGNITPYITMYRTDGKPLDSRGGIFENSSYTGVAFNTPDDPYVNSRLRNVDETVEYVQRGGWLAFIQKYFMAAILTPADREQTLTVMPPEENGGVYRMAVISSDHNTLSPIEVEHRVFVGPKIRSDLIKRASDLELSIDMGWFWFLAQPLTMLLSLINQFAGNWGVSIILLTILIKMLLWPLSAKGFSSMAKMRAVGPKLKETQERYKDDRAKLGTEMMALYKKEGINPAGGCFPLLLQMPVFIAFFFCLRESVELRHEPFLFWIQDLSSPDPFYILPVVFAGLMYLTQQLNPQPPGMDPMQAKVMKVMPLMIAAIFVIMPSGLVVYSIANSAVSLVQQRAMYKKYGAPTNEG